MNCDNNELAHLGHGFTLYYNFKKYLTYLMILLSIIISLPSSILVAMENPGNRNSYERLTNYSGEISIGNILN